ncbi:hypothetical protein FSST1_009736 [Fusarium sambucinum]
MHEIEKLVNIFLNVSEAVAFIWGPIKLVLMMAMTWTNSVKDILDVYEEIADALGNLVFFHTLIRQNDQLKRILEDYFSDILRFHHSILDVFSKPDWIRKFPWAWRNFQRKVKPIIGSLKKKQAMLSDDKLQHHAILKEIQDSDSYAKDHVLFLTGCPGAGKSTLAKIIIRYLKDKRDQQSPSQFSLAYFFFKHNDVDRRSARSMLCNIINQAINGDEATMRFAYDKCSSVDYLELPFLKSLALDCLLSQRNNIIVLDGLDEGVDKESENALRWCLQDLLQEVTSQGCHISLLICGQEDGRIEPLLSSHPQIRLHTANPHQKDIEEFSRTEASKIRNKFVELTSNDEKNLIKKVTGAAEGMFLYAKVVLANLLSMGTMKEYQSELKDDKFPQNLDKAYERILYRVMHAANRSASLCAKRILGWVVCSERPLRWREIQSRFCIDPVKNVCDPDHLRADSCKELCSSLVDAVNCEMFPDIKSEQIITMIHETASKYLVHTNTIDLIQEHIDMSIFSCRYLISTPFLTMEDNKTEEAIRSGYFGFMDYAAVSFRSHIQKAESLHNGTDLTWTVYKAKEALVEVNFRLHNQKAESLDDQTYSLWTIREAKEALAKVKNAYRDASDMIVESDVAVQQPAAESEEGNKILHQVIEEKVLEIRTSIDIHRDNVSRYPGFTGLQGPRRYKCPKIHCVKLSDGFPNRTQLRKHVNVHDRPFRCNDEYCHVHAIGYESEKQLQSHNQKFHNDESTAKVVFPVDNHISEASLLAACRAGDLDKVKLLHLILKKNSRNRSLDLNALTTALEAGQALICKYLIGKGASSLGGIYAQTSSKQSPIYLAICRDNLHLLQLFLVGQSELTDPPNPSHIAECVLEILVHYPVGMRTVLRLLTLEKPTVLSEILGSVVAEQLINMFGIWGRYVGPTKRVAMDHSTNAAAVHTSFRHIFPNLYDQNDKFSPDATRHEYGIYQQALKKQNGLLHDALRWDSYPLATFLMDIDKENELQAQDENGNNALHSFMIESCQVACDGCIIMARRLLKFYGGEFANSPNHLGQLPIHVALSRELSPAVLQNLLKYSQDVNHKDKEGKSPLHYVKLVESMNILLQHKDIDLFSRNKEGQTSFVACCHVDMDFNESILRRLLDADKSLAWTADESAQRLTPLHYAMGLHIPNGKGPSNAATFLLERPEVERILQAFLSSPTKDCEKVRNFAGEQELDNALETMDRIGFL